MVASLAIGDARHLFIYYVIYNMYIHDLILFKYLHTDYVVFI